MSDLPERLRSIVIMDEVNSNNQLGKEAATEIERLTKEVAALNAGFKLRWEADMRAIRRWHEATGRTMIWPMAWPDHEGLTAWLLERLTTAEEANVTLSDDLHFAKVDAQAQIEDLNAKLTVANKELTKTLRCCDCNRPYEKGPDLVVSDEDWAKIAPNPPTGGVLCPNCMNDRFEALGVEPGSIPARFTSGPFAPTPLKTSKGD